MSTSKSLAESQRGSKEISYKEEMKGKTVDPDENDDEPGFARSEKAAQASQLNLSARLSKDGAQGGTFIVILWLSAFAHYICISCPRIYSMSRETAVTIIGVECFSMSLY